MKLSICIPTYNRYYDLRSNLLLLLGIIQEIGQQESVNIYVLDNHSQDETKNISLENSFENSRIVWIRNTKNLGIGANITNCFYCSDAEYIMTLGDDDYISKEYLLEVINIIDNEKPVMILGNFLGVDGEKKYLFGPREKEGPTIISDDYSEKIMWSLELAHQLSGLVYKREYIEEVYKNALKTTLYPQVYMAMLLAGKGVFFHILSHPVYVTQTNSKAWKYDISGYLFDILSGIFYLNINDKEKSKLQIKAVKERPLVVNGRLTRAYRKPFTLFSNLHKEKGLTKRFKLFFVFYFFKSQVKYFLDAIVRRKRLFFGNRNNK